MFGPSLQEPYLGRHVRFDNHKHLVSEKMQVDETTDIKNIDQVVKGQAIVSHIWVCILLLLPAMLKSFNLSVR